MQRRLSWRAFTTPANVAGVAIRLGYSSPDQTRYHCVCVRGTCRSTRRADQNVEAFYLGDWVGTHRLRVEGGKGTPWGSLLHRSEHLPSTTTSGPVPDRLSVSRPHREPVLFLLQNFDFLKKATGIIWFLQ